MFVWFGILISPRIVHINNSTGFSMVLISLKFGTYCSLLSGLQREKRQLSEWKGLLMTLLLLVSIQVFNRCLTLLAMLPFHAQLELVAMHYGKSTVGLGSVSFENHIFFFLWFWHMQMQTFCEAHPSIGFVSHDPQMVGVIFFFQFAANCSRVDKSFVAFLSIKNIF
jgi:hypothetical protein